MGSGRKWRIRAPHIKPKLTRGATNAISMAAVKIARTTSERRLAIRRVPSDTYRISAINRLRLGTCSLQKME